jgi:2-polyprenyl-6-hydroxyphenyl methylase/3-demethylubiquinone-9 3-methyltransferase
MIRTEFGCAPQTATPFNGLKILDIGCGGGLLCEPMARLGANVVGVDAAQRNIPIAVAHAKQSNLTIDYRHGTAEEILTGDEKFDVILNMEVVEHVADPLGYIKTCEALLKDGGMMLCSTINRNTKSFLMAIIGAEYVMRWLPKGTHEWSKFFKPSELENIIEQAGMEMVDKKGFVFNPISWQWSISDKDLSVNYVTTSVKKLV